MADGPSPIPHVVAETAWRETGCLLIQSCGSCDASVFYPRTRCPVCWSSDLRFRHAAGVGVVRSFTHVHRGLPPALAEEAPITLAEIELDEGVVMIARVVGDGVSELGAGCRVRIVEAAQAISYPRPTFQRDE